MPGGEWVLSRMGIQYEGGRMDRCRAPDGWSTTTTTTTTVVDVRAPSARICTRHGVIWVLQSRLC